MKKNATALQLENKPYVLVVEDDSVFRGLVMSRVRRTGFPVLEAATGAIAKSLFASYRDRIGLVVSDGRMPDVNGVDLLRFIRMTSQVPFILVTGNVDTIADAAKAAGANEVVAKPFDTEHFAKLVRQYAEPEADSESEAEQE